MNKIISFLTGALMIVLTIATGCQKDYYNDSGRLSPDFNGNMLQYLESHPMPFDTLVQVIKIAGINPYFTDSSFTFFAPADESIARTYNYLNARLKLNGLDTLTSLSSLKPEFWKNLLEMYMFRGVKGLEDFPQLDYYNKQSFSGEFVSSRAGQLMNIGTVFTNAGQVKYKGLRFLTLNFVQTPSNPYVRWISAYVSSCNIKPKNGIVHALMYVPSLASVSYPQIQAHAFGFDAEQVWQLAVYYGFN